MSKQSMKKQAAWISKTLQDMDLTKEDVADMVRQLVGQARHGDPVAIGELFKQIDRLR